MSQSLGIYNLKSKKFQTQFAIKPLGFFTLIFINKIIVKKPGVLIANYECKQFSQRCLHINTVFVKIIKVFVLTYAAHIILLFYSKTLRDM